MQITEGRTTIPLTRAGTDEVIAHACADCRIVARSEQAALECCAPTKCSACGETLTERRYNDECTACGSKRIDQRERTAFEKAPNVALADYAGEWLFCPCCDEFFEDSDALTDGHDDKPMPEYAWACEPRAMRMSAGSIIENALDDHHEDARDDIAQADEDALQAMLDAWCAKVNVVSYHPTKTAVLLPPREAAPS